MARGCEGGPDPAGTARRAGQRRSSDFGAARATAALAAVALFVWVFAGSAAALQDGFVFGMHVRDPGGVSAVHGSVAAAVGAEAVPVYFRWDETEPSPGRFVVRSQQALVDGAKRRGLRVVGVLAYPDDLPLPTGPVSRTAWPSGHPDDWAFFVAAVLQRFGDDVDAWVVDGGRENRIGELFPAFKAEAYAAFVRMTAATVQRNDPGKLLLAVVPGADIAWLRSFIQHGGMAPLDGLAVDANRWPTPPAGLGVVLSDVAALAASYGERPLLWAWEFGYPTHRPRPADATGGHGAVPGAAAGAGPEAAAGAGPEAATGAGPTGVSESLQARYLVESHVRLRAAGASAVFYSELLDQGPDVFAAEDNFGLYTWTLAPKPAVEAYRTMTRLLAGLDYAGAEDMGRWLSAPGGEEETAIGGGAAAGPRAAAEADVALGGDEETDGGDSDDDGAAWPHQFVFDYELFHEWAAKAGEAVAVHPFVGERGAVVVVWTEPRVGLQGGCRDGCGAVDVLAMLDGVPVRAFDTFGEPVGNQAQWQRGSGPTYLALPVEMVR